MAWSSLSTGSSLALEGWGTTSGVSGHADRKGTDVAGKIRSDLVSLASQGGVSRLIYFITGPLPIGRRHELQVQAARDHQIELDVWDTSAISAELKEHDLFYLAVTYLQLPASLAPEPPPSEVALPVWYIEDRQRWRDRDNPASTIGDLVDLERPLRYATYHAEARADLPDWIAAVRALLAGAQAPIAIARARYELVVAAMGGVGGLHAEDDSVRAYFRDLPAVVADLGVLEDAVLLLEYGCGAWLRAVTAIAREELEGWRSGLRAKVAELLSAGPYPNAEASLLAVAARLALQLQYPDDLRPLRGDASSTVDRPWRRAQNRQRDGGACSDGCIHLLDWWRI